MRYSGKVALTCAALVLAAAPSFAGTTNIADCDRNGDQQITVVDALITLQSVVAHCVKDTECDVDGDSTETASDALALLLYSVGLPVELQCSCIAIDECFDDTDCQVGYPPGYFCLPYRCVQCEFDTDCEPGFTCNRCSYTCEPAAQ